MSHAREDGQGTKGAEAASAWETELGAALEAAADNTSYFPSANLIRTRTKAVSGRNDATRKMVQALKGRSREVEFKYRRIVSLCTAVPEGDIDVVIDSLLRAVESEKGELEIGRVRRFLGGVETGPIR